MNAAVMIGDVRTVLRRLPGHVLDPFGGSGTVGIVASQLGLQSTLIELNPDYAAIAHRKIYGASAEEVAA